MGNFVFGTVLAFLYAGCALAAPVTIQFDSIPVKDFAKVVYGDVVQTGYVVHESAENARISVYLPGVESSKVEKMAADALAASGLSVRRVGGVVVIDKQKEEGEVLIYRPKYRAVSYLKTLLSSAFPGVEFGGRRSAPNVQPVQNNQGVHHQSNVMPISGDVGTSALFDKDDQDVLLGRVPPGRIEAVRSLIAQLDTAAGEVVVRAVAYEVQKTDRKGSALNLVLSLLGGRFGVSLDGKLAGVESSISLKFGGLDAIVSALDSDTRFKSLARPSVRVKSGSLARFAVGSDVPVLGSVVTQQLGNAVQSVEYRSSGVLLDVTPYIRENRIDLKIKEEFSAFVQTATGVQNSPTLNKRSAETQMSLESGEVVVIGGLESTEVTDSSQSGLYGLMYGNSAQHRQNELILLIEAQRI